MEGQNVEVQAGGGDTDFSQEVKKRPGRLMRIEGVKKGAKSYPCILRKRKGGGVGGVTE